MARRDALRDEQGKKSEDLLLRTRSDGGREGQSYPLVCGCRGSTVSGPASRFLAAVYMAASIIWLT